jgi:thymidylate synthase
MKENKADKYFKKTLLEISEEGQLDKNPRPHWKDGTPAHSKFVTQKVFSYDISKGEFPINTLRPTALKGAFFDIEAIYIKQTNIIEEMNPMIHSWWTDFVVESTWLFKDEYGCELGITKNTKPNYSGYIGCKRSIGQTYGHTVRRYGLVDKLLKGLENNPFGRRHMINLWQEQQMLDDPKALVPCCYETLWSVRDLEEIRFIDLTMIQRSMDFAMTVSINPAQYVMFGMMVCNHLTFKTGVKHRLGKFLHIVQNCHIYDRHWNAVEELLERESTGLQPTILLNCPPKDFYSHTVDDFTFVGLDGIKPLSTKLELAV